MKIKQMSILLAIIFLTLSCGSFVKAYAEGNAQLSGLITDIKISPEFSGEITEYTASSANSVSSISVTPTAADTGAQMDVNGTAVTEQQPTVVVPLAVGSNTVTITVACAEKTTTIYTITVTRAGSGNASLQELKVGAGYFSPAFNAGVYAYTLTTNSLAGCLHGQRATTAHSLSVTATTAQADATITINDAAAQSGVAQTIPLQMGANAISVVVTAQDGITQNEYTINALRVSAAWQSLPYQITVSNAVELRLTQIGGMTYAIYDGKLFQYLNDYLQYKVAIPGTDSDTCEVTGWNGIPYLAFRDESGKACVMSYDGADWTALGQTGFSEGAAEDLQICVDAGGTFYVAYIDTANERKATVMRNDGNGWEVVGNKAFTAGEASYLSLALLGGAPALACCDASLGGKGVLWEFAGGTWEMAGDAPFSDGAAHNPSLAADGGTPYIIYQDETCSYRATVKKFTGATWETVGAPGIVPISTHVAIAVFGGDVHICLSGQNYFNEMVFDGTSWKSEGTSVNNGYYNGIFVKDDGDFYCIAYEDSGWDAVVYISKIQDADDATLRWINYHDPVHEYFSFGINLSTIGDSTEYSVDIPGYIETIAICPQASDKLASILIDGATVPYNTKTCSLDFGPNTTTITVLSADGTATKTYTFTINRLKDNSLRGIGVSAGALSPVFYPTDLDYTVKVDSGVKQLVLTPQAFDDNVTIKINGEPVEPGQPSQPVTLAIGQNEIELEVTSADGSSSRTYTVAVDRKPWSWQTEGSAPVNFAGDYMHYAFLDGIPAMIVVDGGSDGSIKLFKCYGSTWTLVNNFPITASGTNWFAECSGIPYTLVGNAVMKYSGNGWERVCYLQVDASDLEGFAVSGGVPIISYRKLYEDGLYVMQYTDTGWVHVGDGSPVNDAAYWSKKSDMAVSNGAVYVAYVLGDHRVTVRKYDGSSWVTLGGQPLPDCQANSIDLAVDGGIPYLAYEYYLSAPSAGLLKYVSGHWVTIDQDHFMYGPYQYIELAVDNSCPFLSNADSTTVHGVSEGVWTEFGDAKLSFPDISQLDSKLSRLSAREATPYLFMSYNGYSIIKYQKSNDAGLMRVGIFSAHGEPSYSASVLAQAGSQALQAEAPSYLDEIFLEPAPADRYATVQIDGQTVNYGSRVPVQLHVGDNDVVIDVRSADGTTAKTYNLHIARKSTDSLLKSLTINGAAVLEFDSGTLSYNIGVVPGAKSSINITASPNYPGASVSGTGICALKYGANTITITVTADDGVTVSKYIVQIYRQSDNSKLASVKVDNATVSVDPGSTIIDFGSVDSGINSVTLSATAEDPNAAITCPSSITLDYGDNQCTISVASEDGTSITSYMLKIYRERPSDNVIIEKIGCGTVTGSGRHYVGDTVSISAEPAEGYEFKQWRVDSGDVQLGNNSSLSTSFTMPGSAVSLTAVFEIRKCSANVQSGGHGKVSGGGAFDWGATVTVSAVPDAGYRFVRWSEGDNTVTSSSQYSFTITRDIALKAEFATIGTPAITSIASSGYNSIKLGWAVVTGASGYELFRSTSATGKYSKVTATTGLTYTNTGLNTGTNYYYKLRVYCTAGAVTTYGQFSAYKTAKPIPATPTSPKAMPVTYNSIKVTWNAVSGASKYEVYRANSSTGSYTLLTTTSYNYYTNTSVNTGSAYYYKVRAYRLVGSTKVYGAFSSVVSARTVLGTPGSMKASPVTYNSIKVTWSAVSGATKYEVYRATSSTGSYTLLTTTSYNYYTNTSVNTGSAYYYKVRAYRLVGSTKVYGSFSAVASTRTVLGTPASVKAARTSSTSIKISWAAVAGATKYEIWRSTSSTGTYTLLTTTGSAYYTNTGLVTGKYYYYKVRAYRLIGATKVYSGFSAVVYENTVVPPLHATDPPHRRRTEEGERTLVRAQEAVWK